MEWYYWYIIIITIILIIFIILTLIIPSWPLLLEQKIKEWRTLKTNYRIIKYPIQKFTPEEQNIIPYDTMKLLWSDNNTNLFSEALR